MAGARPSSSTAHMHGIDRFELTIPCRLRNCFSPLFVLLSVKDAQYENVQHQNAVIVVAKQAILRSFLDIDTGGQQSVAVSHVKVTVLPAGMGLCLGSLRALARTPSLAVALDQPLCR